MNCEQWTGEEVRRGFETIAGQFFQRNFGRMGKADLDVLMFSLYLEHLWKNDLPDDDYSIAVALGITESRVRNLKIKKELQYPSGKNWKKAFVKLIPNALYDDKTALVKLSIPDPNVKREIEHFIDEHNWYSEYQLNSKLLQMRADQFVKLALAINEEYSRESGEPVESEKVIIQRLEKCKSGDWIDEDGKRLIERIRKEPPKEWLGDLLKMAAKPAIRIGMNAVPWTAALEPLVNTLLEM